MKINVFLPLITVVLVSGCNEGAVPQTETATPFQSQAERYEELLVRGTQLRDLLREGKVYIRLNGRHSSILPVDWGAGMLAVARNCAKAKKDVTSLVGMGKRCQLIVKTSVVCKGWKIIGNNINYKYVIQLEKDGQHYVRVRGC